MARNTLLSYRRDLRALPAVPGSRRPDRRSTRSPPPTSRSSSRCCAPGRTDHPPLAASSAARAVVAARGWHRFLFAEGTVTADASRDVRPPTPARRLPKALPVSTVTALLEAASGDDPRGLRDRALLELLYATGARISEAVGLDVDDVDVGRWRSAARRRRGIAGARSAGPDMPACRWCGCAARDPRSGWCRSAPTRSAAVQAYLVRGRPALAAAPVGPRTGAVRCS